jgi:hypothetical protein
MSVIHVGDLVVNSDPRVIGEVLASSTTGNGLHTPTDLDVHDAGIGPRYADSGLVPVRWDGTESDGGPYEWWEDPGFLTVVRRAPVPGPIAVH